MFAGVGAIVKATSASLPGEVLVFFRNLVGALLLLPLLRLGGVPLRTPVFHLHLLRALFGVAALYGYFYVLARIPLGEAVLLILKPGTGLFRPEVLVGILSGTCAAAAMVCVRQLGRRREPATRVVFYFAVLASLVSALPLAWAWQTPASATWPALLAIGVLASAGQYLLTRGYACAPAGQVGPFTYFSVLFSTLLGWWLWSELPDALSGVGALLVIAAGVIALRGRSTRAQTL